MTDDDTPDLDPIVAAHRDVVAHDAAARAARDRRNKLTLDAHDRGASPTDIARGCGVTRAAVYLWMEAAGEDEPHRSA